MSRENQSYLRFSLEESIWFQKEHEVAELYSISLDPNVTIQERDQYVVIKGTLDLSGEYKEERSNGESIIKNYTQHYHPKTVHEVERKDTGNNEFIHRFPVDITIPFNRINSLEDVDVEIQTFDYTLPEKNCLKLQADLLITGIYREQQTITADNEEGYEEEKDYGYVQPEEPPYENRFSEYTENRENAYDHVPHRFEYEESLAEKYTESVSQTNEEPFETFEEYIRKSEAFQNLKGEEEHQRENKQPGSMFERPVTADESFGNRNEEELYTPFFAEAKKLPEEERGEDTPTLMGKQPDIPVFEIPVEPLYDELNSKMQITPKQPETPHPWGDFIQHGSFDIEEESPPQKQEPQEAEQDSLQGQQQQEVEQQEESVRVHQQVTVQQEPEKVQQPITAQQEPEKVQQPITAQQEPERVQPQVPAQQEPERVQPQVPAQQEPEKVQQQVTAHLEPEKVQEPVSAQQEPERVQPQVTAQREPIKAQQVEAAKQFPDRGEKQKVQSEPILESVQAEQESVQNEPVPDAVKANQEPVQKEPAQESNETYEEPVQEESNQASDNTEREPDQVQEDQPKEAIAPILNLARRTDSPSVQEKKNQQDHSSANLENNRDNEGEHLSLMDFFGRKQEEELAKVKVCIVQHGDTISSLADRYEVSVQSLLSSNSLNQDQDVFEGQVLYIPRTQAIKL